MNAQETKGIASAARDGEDADFAKGEFDKCWERLVCIDDQIKPAMLWMFKMGREYERLNPKIPNAVWSGMGRYPDG